MAELSIHRVKTATMERRRGGNGITEWLEFVFTSVDGEETTVVVFQAEGHTLTLEPVVR